MSIGFAPEGVEFQVNTYYYYNQSFPDITGLSDGGYVITWQSSNRGIYGQRYDADGAAIGAEFQIDTDTADTKRYPAITELPDGGFMVVWESNNQDGDSQGIFGQRFDVGGVPSGSEFQVNSYTSNGQTDPQIVTLSDGSCVIVWTSEYQDGSSKGIFGQRLDASGTPVGAEFQINSYTDNAQHEPSLTAMQDGGFVVTWTSQDQDGNDLEIYGQRYDSNGVAVGTEFHVNTSITGEQKESSITSLSDGGFVVTWTSPFGSGTNGEIIGQRYDANGAPIGDEFQINTLAQDSQSISSITALADGGFVVVWQSYNQDGSSWGIYGQRFDANGAVVGDEVQINTHTNSFQNHTTVADLPNGGFVVSWDSYDQDGHRAGVFAQQFKAQLFDTMDGNTMFDTVGANWMDGRGGDDTMYGLDGDDRMVGRGGNDTLFGGDGNDRLLGKRGDDVLDGGAGNDKLVGGIGADRFVFNEVSDSSYGGGSDWIKDFEIGIDDIDLSGIIAGDFTFLGTAGFTGTAAELRAIVTPDGNTRVLIDVDGDGTADMKIMLADVAGLTVDDFIL